MKRAAAALAGGLLALCGITPAAAAAPRVEIGANVVRIPFAYHDHLITISARINGAGPFRLLVDTGATLAVTPAVAKAAHLVTAPDPSMRVTGNGPGAVPSAGIAPVARIDLGGVSLFDVNTIVFDQQIEDGIIGYPLFAALRVTIDFPARELDLSNPQPSPPLAGRVVPMYISQGHFPTVTGSIEGAAGPILVDTGANKGLLVNSTFARDHNISMQYTGFESYGDAVGGSTHETIVAPLTFALGPLRFGRVDTAVSLLTSGMSADPHSAATVGTRLLESYIVTFDYPDQFIAFARP